VITIDSSSGIQPRSAATLLVGLLIAGSVLSASIFVNERVGDAIVLGPVLALLVFAFWTKRGRVWSQRPRRIALPIVVGYITLAAAGTFVSTDRLTSAKYLVGSAAVLSLAYLVMPALLGQRYLAILTSFAFVAGVAMSLMGLILFLFGIANVGHTIAGQYLPVEPVLFGSRAGFTLPLVTGIYASPGNQALGLAIALAAGATLLANESTTKMRWVVRAGIALCTLGLLLTFSRTGWIAGFLGLAVTAIFGMRRRRVMVAALLPMVLLGSAAGLLLLGRLTIDARFDTFASRYGVDAAQSAVKETHATTTLTSSSDGRATQSGAVALKQGADSRSRRYIWAASVNAIRDRPLLGYGLGTDTSAIAPKLTGPATVYRGLTSHSTWLRIAVEGGVPMALVVVLLESLVMLDSLRILNRREVVWTSRAIGALAMSVAFLPALFTETLLPGGLTFLSILWTFSTAALLMGGRGSLEGLPEAQISVDRKKGGQPLTTTAAVRNSTDTSLRRVADGK
jgi:O-antigen ligase